MASAQKCGGVHVKMIEKQKQRLRLDGIGDGDPAEHRRGGAGGAADHDVLRRGPLQPHRINHGVADQRAEGQCRRE